MSLLDSLNETSDKAVDIGEVYYKKSQQYYKLKIFQQLALITSMFFKALVIGILALSGLLFLAVSATIYIGILLGSMALASLLMGILLFVIGLISYFYRRKIDNLIVSKLSPKFFD